MADKAARDAEEAFGFIAAVVQFVDPDSVEPEERIPGVSVPIRAELRAGDERFGLLLASLPATRTWERADQTLLDLYASEIGVAIRNAELFNQVQDQNQQLRQLSEVKDDFLRGVSHNLQTPLTSIRSNADALAATDKDPRLTIISDQADRLTRMVQQLLLVGRLESQPPRPTADVLAIGPRVQRAWDALAVPDRPLRLHDGAPDWLAVADGDQLDQVLWALLDNAVKYGQGQVAVEIGVDPDRTGPVDDGLGRRSWLRGRRSCLAVRPLRARRRRPHQRQRQWPGTLRVARADARHGWRPRARRPGGRARRDVPSDAPGRAGQRGLTESAVSSGTVCIIGASGIARSVRYGSASAVEAPPDRVRCEGNVVIQEPVQPVINGPSGPPSPRRRGGLRMGLLIAAGLALAVPVVAFTAAQRPQAPTIAAGAEASPEASAKVKGPKKDKVFKLNNGNGVGNGNGNGRLKGIGSPRGAITIRAISGSQVSLATEDGWSRTIAVTPATVITKGGQPIAVGDLHVGDQIRFSQTRNADGSYTINAIVVPTPITGGEVTAVGASTHHRQGQGLRDQGHHRHRRDGLPARQGCRVEGGRQGRRQGCCPGDGER